MKTFPLVFLVIIKICITLVSFYSIEWSNLYNTINNKICNVNDVKNSNQKLKLEKVMDSMVSHLIIS